MKKERFEQRLFRIFAEAGYSPVQILTVTPEEIAQIKAAHDAKMAAADKK